MLFLFTTLARLDVVSVFGGNVVYSGSMEPAIRRWDMVIWVNKEYAVGDPIVYCLTRSFCLVHRYIGDCPGVNNCLITRGDANPAPDPIPVYRGMVKGVAVLTVPRELWVPVFTLAVGIALFSISRTRLVGLSAALTYATILLFIAIVYGFTQPVLTQTRVELPALYLSKLYFDNSTCSVVAGYVGNLNITSVEARVNELKAEAWFNTTHIYVYPPLEVISEVYEEGGELEVSLTAGLNNVGKLTGEYSVRVTGEPVLARAVNGSLLLYNPNCFPVRVNVSFQYAYRVGDTWRFTDNETFTIGGFGEKLIEPPKGSSFAYADVYYRARGDTVWVKVAVRYG